MHRFLSFICGLTLVLWGFFFCFRISTTSSYEEYANLWNYRRLHPDFLPSTQTISLLDAGHATTYADILWIDLIQYIGDNTRWNVFTTFINPLISRITDLHPYFSNPYILALLLSPSVDKERADYEANKKISEAALLIGQKGMERNCDQEKIKEIQKRELAKDLWDDIHLRDPCRDGMLPYYSAYVAANIGKPDLAESYYKLASMNIDAPQVSRFLSLLSRAQEWDRLSAAKRFLAIGTDGYDEEPYLCRTTLSSLLGKIATLESITGSLIPEIEGYEARLTPPKDTANPLSSSVTNCYESGQRGIKQLYLSIIDTLTIDIPDIRTGSGIIEARLLSRIPTLSIQKWWTVKKSKKNGWSYFKSPQ